MFERFLCVLRLVVVFPLTLVVSPAAQAQCWDETAKVTASNGVSNDEFGYSVSISGDTAVVGAERYDFNGTDSGSAYVLERNQGGANTWGEVKMITAPIGAANDRFGHAISISGDTVVVGAYEDDNAGGSIAGSAYVFERNQGGANAWGQQPPKLTASDADAGDRFGWSISVSGDTIVVGARKGDGIVDDSGSAYVFERDQGGPNAWGEVAKLSALDGSAGDEFGHSVSISGDTIVVGAYLDDAGGIPFSGSAYVFERNQGGANAWGQVKLKAFNAVLGDHFGYSVSVSVDTIVVGAPNVGNVADFGSAYVFERNLGGPGAWGEHKELMALVGPAGDEFGWAVSIWGDTAVVGDRLGDGSAVDSGSAYVFERDLGGPNAWGKWKEVTASDGAANDQFGRAVSISGDTAVVGARLDDNNNGTDSGSAYVFDEASSVTLYCTAGTSASGCQAFLTACGTSSATAATGFFLTALNVEGAKDGLYFFGSNGRQASSWGSGTSYQCVVPPVKRAGLLNAVGTPGACDGSFSQDFNALWASNPLKNPGAGAIVQAQLWYRDPFNTSNQTTSLSDAIEFLVGP